MKYCPLCGKDLIVIKDDSWASEYKCCKKIYRYIQNDRMSGVYFDTIEVFDSKELISLLK